MLAGDVLERTPKGSKIYRDGVLLPPAKDHLKQFKGSTVREFLEDSSNVAKVEAHKESRYNEDLQHLTELSLRDPEIAKDYRTWSDFIRDQSKK